MSLTKAALAKSAAAALISLAGMAAGSMASAQPYGGYNRDYENNEGYGDRWRCDREADRCAWFRCEADGDDCRRISGWQQRDGDTSYGPGYRDQWRCNDDGGRCAWFRCEPDGDECRRVSGWQNQYSHRRDSDDRY
jgi:hypothetical protein